jgi:hypothetical protein
MNMNNNDNFEKFINDLESIKMTSQEKRTMRHELMDFAGAYKPMVSPYHHISILLRRGAAIAFVAILSFGSFTNFASQDALPGDNFYAIKLAHEELKVATTFDTKKKISYEIRRTEKRIQEATELATESKLDTGKQEFIAENIKRQTKKVQDHIEEIKITEPEAALILNSELKSTIKVNSDALRKISTTTSMQEVAQDTEEIIENLDSEPWALEEDIQDILPSEPVKITTEEGGDPAEEITETSPLEIILGDSSEIDTPDLEVEAINDDIPETQEELEDLTIEPEVEYEEVSISFAENLLESIDEDVEGIQAFEEKVTEEIIKKEQEEIEKSEIIQLIPSTINQEENTTELDIAVIQEEIENLQALTKIQQEINILKADYPEGTYIQEIGFNEEVLEVQIRTHIKEQKHKQAFVILETILRYYKEKNIIKQVTLDLGISLDDLSLDITDVPQPQEIIEEIPTSELKDGVDTILIDTDIISE